MRCVKLYRIAAGALLSVLFSAGALAQPLHQEPQQQTEKQLKHEEHASKEQAKSDKHQRNALRSQAKADKAKRKADKEAEKSRRDTAPTTPR